jgi:hypothetical protein
MAGDPRDLQYLVESELQDLTSVALTDTVPVFDTSDNSIPKTVTVQNLLNASGGLAAIDAVAVDDTLQITDTSSSNASKEATVQQLANSVTVLTAIDAVASGDIFAAADVSASNVAKKVTVAQLDTYLDSRIDAFRPRTLKAEVSLAELNAGKTILAADATKKITVTDFNVVCDGSFTTLTSAEFEDTLGPVVVASFAQAFMTDGTALFKGHSGCTLSSGFGVSLTSGAGLAITKTGSTAAGGTKLTVTATYILEDI